MTKTESEQIREEMNNLREENQVVLNELKDFKVKYALTVENKNETEQSMLHEIKALHSKLGGGDKNFDGDSEARSHYDPGVFNLDDIRRESYAKPLSEYAESSVKMFSYSERRGNRKYNN